MVGWHVTGCHIEKQSTGKDKEWQSKQKESF